MEPERGVVVEAAEAGLFRGSVRAGLPGSIASRSVSNDPCGLGVVASLDFLDGALGVVLSCSFVFLSAVNTEGLVTWFFAARDRVGGSSASSLLGR